jgi:hypothetical protein
VIENDHQLGIAQNRVLQLVRQAAQIRKTATNGENYRLSTAGFLAEIDRMNLEVCAIISGRCPLNTPPLSREPVTRRSIGTKWNIVFPAPMA